MRSRAQRENAVAGGACAEVTTHQSLIIREPVLLMTHDYRLLREPPLEERQFPLGDGSAGGDVGGVVLAVQADGAGEPAVLDRAGHLVPADDAVAGRHDPVPPALRPFVPGDV